VIPKNHIIVINVFVCLLYLFSSAPTPPTPETVSWYDVLTMLLGGAKVTPRNNPNKIKRSDDKPSRAVEEFLTNQFGFKKAKK